MTSGSEVMCRKKVDIPWSIDRQIFYILSSEYPRFFEMLSIHSIAYFTIFGIMTMTKGVYDHGLTPNRGFFI